MTDPADTSGPSVPPRRRRGRVRVWTVLAAPVLIVIPVVSALATGAAFVDSPAAFDGPAGPWLTRGAALAGLICAAGAVLTLLLAVAGLLGRRGLPRSWVLVVPALIVTVAGLVMVPGGPYPTLPAGDAEATGPALRVMSANVLMTNPDDGRGLAAEIADVDPDVLVLIETGPATEEALAPVLARYRYSLVSEPYADEPSAGLALYSKVPLTDAVAVNDRPRPVLAATIEMGREPVTVIAFHPAAPVDRAWSTAWYSELTDLSSMIPAAGPVIVAGDFNATIAHAPFRALLAEHRLHDTTGSAPTWPQHGYPIPLLGLDGPTLSTPIPPVLGLDHVLTRGLVTRSVAIGRGEGSDHRPVIAEVVLGSAR